MQNAEVSLSPDHKLLQACLPWRGWSEQLILKELKDLCSQISEQGSLAPNNCAGVDKIAHLRKKGLLSKLWKTDWKSGQR